MINVFSHEPRLYKRVCPSVGPSVGPLVMLLSAGRDEPANDLFRVYELVNSQTTTSGSLLSKLDSATELQLIIVNSYPHAE